MGGFSYPITHEQRVAATNKSIADRQVRSRTKDSLKRGVLTLQQVLDDAHADEAVARLRVSALLEAMPGVGKVRAGQLLSELGIAPSRRVRGLGRRQREALLQQFPS